MMYIKIEEVNLNNLANHYNIKKIYSTLIKLCYKRLRIYLYNEMNFIKILTKLLQSF